MDTYLITDMYHHIDYASTKIVSCELGSIKIGNA